MSYTVAPIAGGLYRASDGVLTAFGPSATEALCALMILGSVAIGTR